MSDSIPIKSKLARSIFGQWLGLKMSSTFYKCTKCRFAEYRFESPNNNCPPSHKSGIQAYLAVDATPEQGGIAFFTSCGDCFYYQPVFEELGIAINKAKPTEFEMINLLIALCIFKTEILNHKTVRVIVDNNYLRKKGKMQRHALTEAIAAILEWCDNFGCTINDIFQSNEPGDEPYMKIADALSRNKDIQQWLKQKKEIVWHVVTRPDYHAINPKINEDILGPVNEILQEPVKPESRLSVVESSSSHSRFRKMLQYFETTFFD